MVGVYDVTVPVPQEVAPGDQVAVNVAVSGRRSPTVYFERPIMVLELNQTDLQLTRSIPVGATKFS
jgi:hypothetical protein